MYITSNRGIYLKYEAAWKTEGIKIKYIWKKKFQENVLPL